MKEAFKDFDIRFISLVPNIVDKVATRIWNQVYCSLILIF